MFYFLGQLPTVSNSLAFTHSLSTKLRFYSPSSRALWAPPLLTFSPSDGLPVGCHQQFSPARLISFPVSVYFYFCCLPAVRIISFFVVVVIVCSSGPPTSFRHLKECSIHKFTRSTVVINEGDFELVTRNTRFSHRRKHRAAGFPI